MRKVLAFDLDETLGPAKTAIPLEMAKIILDLTKYYEIALITGQKFSQCLSQFVDRLWQAGATPENLSQIHLFPNQGTEYYTFVGKSWQEQYCYPLSNEQVYKITDTLERAAKQLGYWNEEVLKKGDEIIENRLSQVTFSALGQRASIEDKKLWDPDHTKRLKIAKICESLAPEFSFKIGGTTSIDVSTPDRNKSFGMKHLLSELNLQKSEVLYFGDLTMPGGNDYPIVEMGIDTVTVTKWQDTFWTLKGILAISQ